MVSSWLWDPYGRQNRARANSGSTISRFSTFPFFPFFQILDDFWSLLGSPEGSEMGSKSDVFFDPFPNASFFAFGGSQNRTKNRNLRPRGRPAGIFGRRFRNGRRPPRLLELEDSGPWSSTLVPLAGAADPTAFGLLRHRACGQRKAGYKC